MRFEWDENKNRENIRKHGLDLADAWEAFAGPLLIALDDRKEYGEDRWIGIGMLRGRIVVVTYAEEVEGIVRIISVRKAASDERKQFEQYFKNQLGPG